MIFFADGDSLVAIAQSDHARFAAELMTLWRTGDLPDHPRRDDVLFAIREHDNGWREADAAPRIDPESGRPLAFHEVPSAERIEIWRRATGRVVDRPFSALLIVEHARRLHVRLRGKPGWGEFLADLDTLRGDLLLTSGLDAAQVERADAWVELADALSLAACSRRSDSFVCNGIEATASAEKLALEPFPLAGATRFAVPCRRIPSRGYSSDLALGMALAEARWHTTPVHVLPKSLL